MRLERLEVQSALERCSNIRGLPLYQLPSSPPLTESGSGDGNGDEKQPLVVPRATARLCLHKRLAALLSPDVPGCKASLMRNVLGASTTDHTEESAINLLVPEERTTFGLGLSYWSSKGASVRKWDSLCVLFSCGSEVMTEEETQENVVRMRACIWRRCLCSA